MGLCGALAMTTLHGATLEATEEDSFREWPAPPIIFTHRQMSRVSTSMKTRGGILSPATPTGIEVKRSAVHTFPKAEVVFHLFAFL